MATASWSSSASRTRLPNGATIAHINETNRITEDVATFLKLPFAEEQLPVIMQAVSLEAMSDKAVRAERAEPNRAPVWKEGAKSFFFKGTNGRWRDVLSAEEVALYEEKAGRLLTPACRAWLEH